MNKWFIFRGSELLLTRTHNAIPVSEKPPIPFPPHSRRQELPLLEGMPCTAFMIAETTPIPPEYILVNLRQTFVLLPQPDYIMGGKARELLYWDARNRFCGHCGTPLTPQTEISKVCPQCHEEFWPSPSTAVITLIERPSPDGNRNADEVLLVQAHNFSGDFYGLVAGFVETGETLEEAVRREIMEETGIRVRNLRYRASQPWPYPNTLMVGFTAEYESGELSLQHSELRKGGWFRRDNLPTIPGNVSLARRLIDEWLFA